MILNIWNPVKADIFYPPSPPPPLPLPSPSPSPAISISLTWLFFFSLPSLPPLHPIFPEDRSTSPDDKHTLNPLINIFSFPPSFAPIGYDVAVTCLLGQSPVSPSPSTSSGITFLFRAQPRVSRFSKDQPGKGLEERFPTQVHWPAESNSGRHPDSLDHIESQLLDSFMTYRCQARKNSHSPPQPVTVKVKGRSSSLTIFRFLLCSE